MSDSTSDLQIGCWTVFPGQNRLLAPDGQRRHISPKAMDVLVALASQPGEVVSKDALLKTVWQRGFVTEGVLANAVRELRQALGDDARQPAYIETIAKRGYRLVAAVGEPPVAARPAAPLPLRRSAWLGVAILAAVLGILALWSGSSRAPEPTRLAVLSFDDLSPTATDPAFAHGVRDVLMSELAALDGLRVVSGNGLEQLAEPEHAPTIERIASRLDAELLLRGSALLAGNRVRVTARLLDGASAATLWSGSYESDLRDVIDLQREIARTIVREIRVTLSPGDRHRLTDAGSVDPDAFMDYAKGVHLFDQWEKRSLPRSREYFERAIAKDPGFAPARARLARSLVALAIVEGIDAAEAYPRALRAARAAVRLDATQPEGHAAVALVALLLQWDRQAAEDAIARAIELNPGSAFVHEVASLIHMAAGRHQENIAAIKRAHALAPFSYYYNLRLAWSHHMAGQYEPAVEALLATRELYPEKQTVDFFLAQNYAMLGRAEDARRACEPVAHKCVWVYAKIGQRDRVERWLREIGAAGVGRQRAAPDRAELAGVLAALGRREAAFEQLTRVIDAGSPDAVFLGVDPMFEPVREDPIMQNLLARVRRGSPLAVTTGKDRVDVAARSPE